MLVCVSLYAKESKFKIGEMVEGELIIKLKDKQLSKSFYKLNGLEVKKNLDLEIGFFQVVQTNAKNNKSLNSLLHSLNQDPAIEYAEPNYKYQVILNKHNQLDITDVLTNNFATHDPMYNKLWGLENTGNNEPQSRGTNSSPSGVAGADVNALAAWNITKGDRSIKIAVIDTGVDYNHEDLRDNMWVNTAEANGKPGVDDDGNGYVDDIHGYDFANNDGDPMDGNGHGTHCSGTIAAEHDNNKGIAGVMSQAQIVAIKFLTDQGSGSTDDAISAINYATKIGVDIMSNSWGGGGHSRALEEAIELARDRGIIFTAAAGNSASDNDTDPQYPANYPVDNIISVAAHNYNNQLASFSCYGSDTVHVAAPGRNILSTTPGNTYSVYSGTSMATPHVTGVIGLYLSHHGKVNPKVVRDKLMASSVYAGAYARTTISGGRVDAYNFLTDVVTSRPAKPDDSQWQSKSVDIFTTAHPYAENTSLSKTYTHAGAKFMRLKIEKMEIEESYDSLKIFDGKGNIIQTLDGSHSQITTDYVDGDSITVVFESDSSVNGWGVEINEVDYIE
tara:strand:- start:10516 stop:12195 length:1680 start_codon:yes stop_codon:yes gene_type:complete